MFGYLVAIDIQIWQQNDVLFLGNWSPVTGRTESFMLSAIIHFVVIFLKISITAVIGS